MPDLVSIPLPHACLRAKERYGLELTGADLREIARRCKGGEGLLAWAERQRHG